MPYSQAALSAPATAAPAAPVVCEEAPPLSNPAAVLHIPCAPQLQSAPLSAPPSPPTSPPAAGFGSRIGQVHAALGQAQAALEDTRSLPLQGGPFAPAGGIGFPPESLWRMAPWGAPIGKSDSLMLFQSPVFQFCLIFYAFMVRSLEGEASLTLDFQLGAVVLAMFTLVHAVGGTRAAAFVGCTANVLVYVFHVARMVVVPPRTVSHEPIRTPRLAAE